KNVVSKSKLVKKVDLLKALSDCRSTT
ncbi:hypothetical protein CMV_022668, partial [Castanea mollissima]